MQTMKHDPKQDDAAPRSRRRERSEVPGLLVGGALLACVIGVAALGGSARADEPKDDNDDRGKVEVEGIVGEVKGSCPNLELTIGGQRVVTDAATRFEDGACADVGKGKKLDVDAVPAQDGALRATKVDFD
jgi:hypothetical protein